MKHPNTGKLAMTSPLVAKKLGGGTLYSPESKRAEDERAQPAARAPEWRPGKRNDYED